MPFSDQITTFFFCAVLACLYDQNKSLSSQSEQFEKFSKSSDWLEKSRPSKKTAFVSIM